MSTGGDGRAEVIVASAATRAVASAATESRDAPVLRFARLADLPIAAASEPAEAEELLRREHPVWAELPPARQAQVVSSRLLLREAVRAVGGTWSGLVADALTLHPGGGARGGGPRLADTAGAPLPTSVSISHSGDRILVGLVLQGRIGVDVEETITLGAVRGLLRRGCAPSERRELAAHGAEAHPDRVLANRLTRLWTVKEAWLKAQGTGLRTDPRDVVVSALRRRPDVHVIDVTVGAGAHASAVVVTGTGAAGRE